MHKLLDSGHNQSLLKKNLWIESKTKHKTDITVKSGLAYRLPLGVQLSLVDIVNWQSHECKWLGWKLQYQKWWPMLVHTAGLEAAMPDVVAYVISVAVLSG